MEFFQHLTNDHGEVSALLAFFSGQMQYLTLLARAFVHRLQEWASSREKP